MVDTIINDPFEDLGMKRKEEEEEIDQGISDPYADLGLEPPKPVATPVPTSPPEAAPVIAPDQTAEPVEVSDPFSDFGMSREPEKGPLTVADVAADPVRVGKIRQYMSRSADKIYETAPVEELMEAFMEKQRFLHTNEVSTAKELYRVYGADDEERAIYGEAYKIYDEMGSIFNNGDAWNGFLDYAESFVKAPSTYLGFGIGRVAGQAGSKAAMAKAMEMGVNATTKAIANQGKGKVVEEVVKQQLRSEAARVTARTAIIGAVGVEGGFATLSDYAFQKTRTLTGVQDEYSFLQGAASLALGSVSAAPAVGLLLKSRKGTLAQSGRLIDEANAARQASVAERAVPRLEESIKKAQVDWLKLAEAGKGLEKNTALEDAILDWMVNPRREDSLFTILRTEGANLSFRKDHFAEDLFAYAKGMGPEALERFNEALKPLGEVRFGDIVEVLNFDRATEMAAASLRRAGQTFQPVSEASRVWNKLGNTISARQHANKTLVDDVMQEADEEAAEAAKQALKGRDLMGYGTSTWKGVITATPMTTMTNVKGWLMVNRTEALSDLFVAGSILGKAGLKAVVGKGSAKDLARVRAISQNQIYALNTFLDPFTTAEGFYNILNKAAPKKTRDRLAGQLFGGVETFSPERFGLDPKARGVRLTEGYTKLAQDISLMRLQDVLTKGMTGMQSLDKQTRLKLGKGIEQTIRDGETWKITDEMWEEVYDRIAKETISEDFSKGEFALRWAADAIQKVSSSSIGGLFVPFGRFMNGVMAYAWRYSIFGLFSVGSRVFYRGKGFDEQAGQMLARSIVGTSIMGYMALQAAQDQEQGLQWNEVRTADGDVQDITNIFPANIFKLSGRILHNMVTGEGGNTELIESLKNSLADFSLLEDFASLQWLRPITEFLTDERVEIEDKNIVKDGVQLFMETVAGIGAGFTRPLDPINRALPDAVEVFGGSRDVVGGGLTIDRKQSRGFEKTALEATRYVSNFFNFAFGEENEDGVRMVGKPRESASSLGPVQEPLVFPLVFHGTRVSPAPRNNINRLLGMVDMPPFRADTYTSGNAEFDAMMNSYISSHLEAGAKSLLEQESFKSAPQSLKIKMVNQLITDTERQLLSALDGRVVGDDNDRLLVGRRNFLTHSRGERIRARKALGITTPDHKLTQYELDMMRLYMQAENESLKR